MKSLASIMKLSHRKFIAVAMATGIAASGSLVWSASNAAFTSTTNNDTNSWTTGAVTITDDDGGSTAMFTAGENALLLPGAGGYQCIKVTYQGNVAADVKLMTSAHTTSALEAQVHLTVEINDETTGATDTGDFGDNATGCNDNVTNALFHPDADGTSYTGTLADFWTKYNTTNGNTPAGVIDLGGAWHPTAATQYRVYRFHWWLDASVDGAAHQNETCTMDFRWIATQA